MKPPLQKSVLIAVGPTLSVLIWTFFDLVPGERSVTWMTGIAVWMAWWWLTEAVHFGITSLIPIIALPAFGIYSIADTVTEYLDRILFVFAGGFVIAMALEKWNLHRRIAFFMLSKFGKSPAGVLAGILLTTYLLSMWISNTATVMMMIPAVTAIAGEALHVDVSEKGKRSFFAALLLGLAYAATIGGMATLVGTPTNMIFYSKITDLFGANSGVTFSSWFIFAGPLSFLLLGICGLILYFVFLYKAKLGHIRTAAFRDDLRKLGPWTLQEKIVGFTFLFTALAWFLRSDIKTEFFTLHGWGSLIPKAYAFYNHDFLPAVIGAIFLLLAPSGTGGRILQFKELKRFPIEIILLFGGGFALAKGMEVSGMSNWMAGALRSFGGLDPLVFLLAMTLMITIISEFASNVACIQLMIPILLAVYQGMGVTALYLLIPATLASSLGFMLPVATAPNTIVFSTRKIKTSEMMKAGFLLDVAGILLVALFSWWLGGIYFK